MKKVVRLTESDLVNIIKRVIKEQEVSEDNLIDDFKDNIGDMAYNLKRKIKDVKSDLGFPNREDKDAYTITKEIQTKAENYLSSLNFNKDEGNGIIFYYDNNKKPVIVFDSNTCRVYVSLKLVKELATKFDLIIPKEYDRRGKIYFTEYYAGFNLASNWVRNTEDLRGCKGIAPETLYDSNVNGLSSLKDMDEKTYREMMRRAQQASRDYSSNRRSSGGSTGSGLFGMGTGMSAFF